MAHLQPKKVYLGKPENQRDPNAVVPPRAPFAVEPVQQVQPTQAKALSGRPKKKLPLTINKPTKAPVQQAIQQAGDMPPPTNVDPMRNSVFIVAMSNREVSLNTKITPSAPTLIDISRATHAELLADEANLNKTLLPEYLDYYATALLWFRFCTLKVKLKQPITPEERDLLLQLEQLNFSVPEPILLQLRVFGSTQTMTREHLYPTFPSLPNQEIGAFGGYFGSLDPTTHNLYEEIPCLGVTGEAIRRSISNEPPGPYVSSLTTEHLTVNQNLLGYRNLGSRRNEAKNLAFDCGITPEEFPSFPAATGLNMDLVNGISAILAQTHTFKVTSVSFPTLAECGSVVQAVIERPTLPTIPNRLEKAGELEVTALMNEDLSTLGSGIAFCPQLWKEAATIPTAPAWSCATPVPQAWIDNRNLRRHTLPTHYRATVFRSITQNGREYRNNVVRLLVTTKR